MRCLLHIFVFVMLAPVWAAGTGLTGFNVAPSASAIDGSGVGRVLGARIQAQWVPRIQTVTSIAGSMLQAGNPVNAQQTSILTTTYRQELAAVMGITPNTMLGIQIPTYPFIRGKDVDQNSYNAMSLGDVALMGKVRLFDRTASSMGIALASHLTIPTGSVTKFTGDNTVSANITAILDRHWRNFYGVVNIGYAARPKQVVQTVRGNIPWNITNDDRFHFGAAFRAKLPWQEQSWQLGAGIAGETVVRNLRKLTTPVEVFGEVSKRLPNGLTISFGGGRGLVSAIGSPAYRVYGGLAFDFSRSNQSVVPDFAKATVSFAFDNAKIDTGDASRLQKIGAWLAKQPEKQVNVVGYTDNIGSQSYNLALSRRRAANVVQELIRAGASEDQISLFGHGEACPIASNATVRGRARNRRVEIQEVVGSYAEADYL